MGFVKGSYKACVFIGFLFIVNCVFATQENGNEERKIYIVHLGQRQHDDPDLVSDSHRRKLESVFESPEDARESIIYNYRHGFSGFSARLTDSQAKKLSDHPDVLHVTQNRELQLTSTRLFDYLGVSPTLPRGILHETEMGSDRVIGFIDSGVWPESPVFDDTGLGPIPKHWKGKCVAGEDFDPAIHCNKKLVGAKYFLDGWEKQFPGVKVHEEDYMSPRDGKGHGTSVCSLGASSFVPNASMSGLAPGLLRGAAPKARIAMYKVSWNKQSLGFETGIVNALKAFDEAIKDGVDVLSVSSGPSSTPLRPFNLLDEGFELGSFYAVNKGIPVVVSAGNSGPGAYSVVNVAPWVFTVGATSIDRTFYVDMTLGNNITYMGQSIYTKDTEVSGPLVYVDDWQNNKSNLKGKVALTFVKEDLQTTEALFHMMNAGAAGAILARSSNIEPPYSPLRPAVHIDYELGFKILRYIRSSSSPTIKITHAKTLVGRPIATQVSGFSSRGPNSVSPAILKPDIAAPGSMVLTASTLKSPVMDDGYQLNVGTSFSTPVVAGLVLLLKSLHPDWSPAALKSAIMTTAWKTDPYGEPIFAEGVPRKLADPFDYGAGLVNIEKAKDPGLVYDMNLDDYIHYFCASNYNDTAITILTGKPTKCSSPLPSILDVNYPAITIPDLEDEVIVSRTVTNVGPVDSVYRAIIEPLEGVNIAVEPKTLVFNSSTTKLVFKVKVSTTHKSNTGYFFGSFSWTDGTRNVYIPLSVRTRVLNP